MEFNGSWTETSSSLVLEVRVAARSNRHGNCATVIVDTVVLRKFRAACVSEITVEITAFLPCSLMRETEYFL